MRNRARATGQRRRAGVKMCGCRGAATLRPYTKNFIGGGGLRFLDPLAGHSLAFTVCLERRGRSSLRENPTIFVTCRGGPVSHKGMPSSHVRPVWVDIWFLYPLWVITSHLPSFWNDTEVVPYGKTSTIFVTCRGGPVSHKGMPSSHVRPVWVDIWFLDPLRGVASHLPFVWNDTEEMHGTERHPVFGPPCGAVVPYGKTSTIFVTCRVNFQFANAK